MRLYVLFAVLGLAVLPGCSGATAATTIPAVEAAITDAEIAVQIVGSAADAYFAAHPNAALQTKVDDAVSDTETALRAVNTALAGAASVSDGNVQAALAAFSDAFTALSGLVAQIGIQVSTVAGRNVRAMRGPGGIVIVAPPIILQNLVRR